MVNNDNKLKDEKIIVRIEPELKQKFLNIVTKKGTTISDCIRQFIVDMINNEENFKSESLKETLMKITNPEIEIIQRLNEMDKHIEYLEARLKKTKNK